VAVNNAFNTACKDVVNQMLEKFASEGAKSTYDVPPFRRVHIKINLADRAALYLVAMQERFEKLDLKSVHLEQLLSWGHILFQTQI
jgi:hypothetical protein